MADDCRLDVQRWFHIDKANKNAIQREKALGDRWGIVLIAKLT